MKLSRYRQIIVLSIDLLLLIIINVTVYYHLGKYVGMGRLSIRLYLLHLSIMALCSVTSQLIYKTYASLWRYAQSKEYLRLLLGGVTGYSMYLFIELMVPGKAIGGIYTISVYTLYLLCMLVMRFSYRQYRLYKRKVKRVKRVPIVIIGAGEAGVKLLEELQSNPNSSYYPVCFIDDSEEKIGKRIHNIKVRGPISSMKELLAKENIREIVIAIPSLSVQRQTEIFEECAKMKCTVKIVPDYLAFMNVKSSQDLWSIVSEINVEELLGREIVQLGAKEIEDFLHDKVVLVTGGGGSIGSELCRQIAKARPEKLIIIDNYENNAYEIQQELCLRYHEVLRLYVEIASIRDREKIYNIFHKYKPQIVFHAAAHKHVPLMEVCPDEAVKNNIFGTYNLVMAANQYKVERFILISTDKAVNPTNIMGASKKFCEMMLQSMKENSKTEYVAVRFGNVLGSNGSVIPLFQRQIAAGGPVTITDKRIVRYFMTITEAVQLVLQAGAMANKSEIYVLDMGNPVKILNLAENLIRLSGFVPYKDIDIIEVGLRPGEKLFEEILTKSSDLIATANNKIFIEIQRDITKEEIVEGLNLLDRALRSKSPSDIKNALKVLVPSYKDPKEVNCIVEQGTVKTDLTKSHSNIN